MTVSVELKNDVPGVGSRQPSFPVATGPLGVRRGDSIDVRIESEILGRGACSTVYSGRIGSLRVAVKRLNPEQDGNRGRRIREAEILSQLNHENIVKFYGKNENPVGSLDFVLELAEGVTLARALFQRYSRTDSWKRLTIFQISDALAYLHGRNILHLDLKPPNILFRDRELTQPLIADFGMARKANFANRAGARKFRAPESCYTRASDVFSLASIGCCILAERNPGDEDETKRIVARVLTYTFYDPEWRTALSMGVQRDPSLRPTAAQFRDVFDKTPYRLEIPHVDIGYQVGDNASSTCRWLALIAVFIVIGLILLALFSRMFSSK